MSRASGTREISRSCLCVGVFISLMIEQAISFTEKPILPYSSIDFFHRVRTHVTEFPSSLFLSVRFGGVKHTHVLTRPSPPSTHRTLRRAKWKLRPRRTRTRSAPGASVLLSVST